MPSAFPARPAISGAATLFLFACEPFSPAEPDGSQPVTAAALATYFPPPESSGGWRKVTEAYRMSDMGMSRDRLQSLGSYLMSLPHEEYSTGISGYKASNKAAIVVKDGWIVGEWYNQPGADRALYYTASERQDLRHAAGRQPGADAAGARPRRHEQAVRPAVDG
jgi:hypothetical protein